MQYVSFADTPLSVDELNPHTWVLTLDAPVTPDDTARLGRALDEAAPPGVNLLVWDEADDDPPGRHRAGRGLAPTGQQSVRRG